MQALLFLVHLQMVVLLKVIEVKNHPFFVGTQAHPELKSRPNNAHPLFRGFVDAILELKK